MTREPKRRRPTPNCLVFHGPGFDAVALGAPPQSCKEPDGVFKLRRGHSEPAVLLVDETLLVRAEELRRLPPRIVFVATDERSEHALGGRIDVSLVGVEQEIARRRLFDAACQLAVTRAVARSTRRRLDHARRVFDELREIGMALMLERDRATLLHQIVDHLKRFTQSDAGIMLLIETGEDGEQRLRPVAYEFDSLPNLPPVPQTVPIDNTSIMGHAAMVKEPVVIADSYALPPDANFSRNPAFDKQFGYWTRSMLIVPMVDHVDRLIGELVLVNRKSERGARIDGKAAADKYVLEYTDRQVNVARALASVAAVSIENAQLHVQVERTLEGVVKAAVSAIDQRDPSTKGHSVRVATLALDLAAAVDRAGRGAYRDTHFTRRQMRELYFASLLHDFGKVTVHEDVLLKAKKLPPLLAERVANRFDLIRRTMEVDHQMARARLACSSAAPADGARLDAEFADRIRQLDHMRQVVRDANEPTVLAEPASAELPAIAKRTFEMLDGSMMPFLTPDELRFLQISRGTLDEHERAEIESHVEETHRFLAHIPWTDDLKDLVTYAYGHHEKLNGSGYPKRLVAKDIPVQTRLITIADMFDALTESDRPYKPAVAPERALEIMKSDADAGLLDKDLIDIMVEEKVYRRVVDEDWERLWKTPVEQDLLR
jgi:HD-GYP domain-containing protein (c-di-GMP phosphodiesterase class II)